MRKYRLLNEVLIEWNKSSLEDSGNVFLKPEDIKESLDRCFIYRLDEKDHIKIFDERWPEFEKYKDKVWIDNKHVELNGNGQTANYFEPRKYRVYIKDIDKVTDMAYMFYNCPQLVSAFIPESVTKIGYWVFGHCTGLTTVTIPDSVTSIEKSAFPCCYILTSVTIPNSVKFIGSSAFYRCTGLTTVTIPNSVTVVGDFAFAGCRDLKTVYVEDINKFNQIEFKGEMADPRCYGAKLIELKK